MAKQGLENLQKKQNITKTTTSGVKANLPSTAKPNLPSQPSVPSVSDNTVQTLVDNLQPKKQTSVPVRDQYSVASAFKNVPVDSFTGNTLTTAGAATIDLLKNTVNAPPAIAESASRLGYNLLKSPVTDMRSKVTPQEITKSDSGVRGLAHTLAEGLFGVPEQKEQKQDDSLLNAVKQQFASVGDEPVKQITEWTDPWNKTLQNAVQGVDSAAEAYRSAVQPVTDWMTNAAEQTRSLAEEQYGQNLSPVAHFVSDAIGSIAPNVARRLMVGGLSGDNAALYRTLSDVAMFSTAFVPAYEEAKAKGLSDSEARLDALFRASIETGTEHLSDTFNRVGGRTDWDEAALTRIANSNMNPFLKYISAVNWSSVGEAFEEGASSGLNKGADWYMYGTPIDIGTAVTDITKEAAAGYIAAFVESLLGGTGSYNRYAQQFERLMQDKSGEVSEDVAKAYKDELRKEFALVWASMTGNVAEGEYYDPVALELISTAQDKMRSLYGEDDEIANMSPFELLQRVDDIAQREIMDMSPEQYEEYRDRVNGTEAPIVTMGTPDGGTYEVYAYIGEKTDDQVRMLDLADRHGQNVILVDSLYGNQNAATLDDGTILISAKAKKPIQTLIFHEMFHALRSDGKWNDLLELAYDARSKEDGFEEWRDNLMATYLPYYGQVDLDRIRELASYSITRDEEQRKQDVHDELIREANEQYKQGGAFKDKIDEEVAADYMERLGNEETIRNMYNRSGDIFDRVYQGIKDAVRLASGKATGEGRTLLEAERLFSKVARQEMREQQRAEQYLLQNGYNFHGADGTLYSVGYSTADANLANVDREQLINDIVTASKGAITDEKARQFVEDEEVMAMSIKDTALDFEAEPGEEAIKKNTDYPQGTIDLTNNCTKRRAITYMTNRLQEELPDDLFTADDYADIRLIMMDDGRVVACGLCFVEDRRKQLGEIAQTFRDEWANSEDGYLWRTNSSGNRVKVSIGKDLAKRYGVKSGLVTVNDLNMQQVNFGSSDSWHKFQKEHPYEAAAFEAFNNARGQNAGRLLVPRAEYKREILSWSPEKVQSVNDLGGLRIFSFSDFESIHMLDIIQIIEDCAARGVMIQGYTKQPNFAKLVRNTGIKLNRSLIPYGATGLKIVNGRLVLAMNTAEGMDITSKDFIDETDNPNVGNNITGINDKQIHVAMTDDFIHYIIPFHTGKSNEANLRLGVGKWDNYKDYQIDKSLSAEDTKRLALRTSELKAQGMDDTEAYKRAMKELKIKPTAGKMINIYTEVLSDPTVNNVVAFQNKFFEVCYEKGITPRFSQFLDTDANGKFVYTPGYEKMLVDFKLFDKDGNLLKQEVVKPDFERSFMQQIIDDDLKKTEEELQGADYPQELYDKVLNYIRVKHGYEGDYQAYEELKEKIDKNVTNLNSDNESVQGYALSPSVMNSLMELNVQRPGINDRYSQFPAAMFSLSDEELDQQYFDALEREGEDSPTARRLLEERAAERGYTDRAYHGTDQFGFTVPDTQKSDDKKSFFVASTPSVASSYSGVTDIRRLNDEEYDDEAIERIEEGARESASILANALSRRAGYYNYIDGNYIDDEFRRIASQSDKEKADQEMYELLDSWIYDAWSPDDENEEFDDWQETDEAQELYSAGNGVISKYIAASEAEGKSFGIYDLLVNPEGLTNYDADRKNWNDLDLNLDEDAPYIRGAAPGKWTTRSLADYESRQNSKGYKLDNVVDIGRYGDNFGDVASVYDLFNPQSQVKSNDPVTYDDEKNIIPPSQRFNPNKNDIRYSLSDEQEDYFQNSQVRDENGNLLEVYHGSPNRGITEFDPSRSGQHSGAFGDNAIWFTPNRDFAEEFAYQFEPGNSNLTYRRGEQGEVYPAYLNMTNPLDFNNLTDEQRDLFRDRMSMYGESDRQRQDEIINQLLDAGNHQYLKSFLDYDKAREQGYDGVIDRLFALAQDRGDDMEYGVFNPNQVKSSDNIRPTKSPDIRYSIAELQNEYEEALKANDPDWQSMLVNQAAYLNGYTTGAYHGSPITDITVFNTRSGEEKPQKMQLLFGTHFTQNKDYADIYARKTKKSKGTSRMSSKYGKVYDVYLDLGKSLDLQTAKNFVEGDEEYQLYKELPAKIQKRYPPRTFTDYETSIGMGSGEYVNVGQIEQALQAMSPKEATDFLVDHGYNSVKYLADYSTPMAYGRMTRDPSIIMLDPERIKSADPVTYDKNGNVIPLSERFNPNKDDIRYSLSEDIPEQANAFPDRNVPRDRSAMRTLGSISRERGESLDPLSYEEVSPENLPEPEDYFDVKTLLENEDSKRYGFEEDDLKAPTEADIDLYRSLSANKTGALQGFATIGQTLDRVAQGEAREELRQKFEVPMYDTKKAYNQAREKQWSELESMIKKTGIKANTPESAAVQWYGEGVKANEQGETVPYTLNDLKREFPNNWEKIVEMEQYMRKTYDEYVDRINTALEQVYPNLEEKAQVQLNKWRIQMQVLQDQRELTRNNPAVEDYLEREIAKYEGKIQKLQGDLDSGEYFRNKRLRPRKDYFHHFQEVETQGIGGLKNILQATTLIDPELVGKSANTKPRARWMAWLQPRGQGAYTADAVLGMGKYIDGAEYAIAFDPLIAQYRDEVSKMVQATKKTKNANQLIQYLSAYTNQLAGKTPSLDRTILDLLGEGNRGQLFNALSAINNRAKSNAVVGNVRSAVAQFFNIPNAMSIIKSDKAWGKGVADYISAKLGNRDLLEQSPFLQERYWDHSVDDLKARNTVWEKLKGKASDVTNAMMEFGDREATELIWLVAYNEGKDKGVADPVYYADDLTRRSVAGRGIGEVPYNMKSKVASFFMPFQVESNNQWQNLKGMLKDKDAKGIFRLMLGTYLMNAMVKPLFNDGVLPDILGALVDGIKKLFDKDREETVGEIALDTGKRMAGEAVSMIPGTSLWLPAIMSSDSAEALFGDSDPTRYGTGTVGLSNITKTLADAVDGDDYFDLMTPLLQLGLPYGGKQASRLYNTLQDFNVLPSNGWANTPINGETNPVNGDYSRAGALRYTLPNEVNSWDDAAEIARAFMFGSNATNAAQEYYDTGKPALSAEKVAKLREDPNLDPELYIQYLKEANADGSGGISQQEASEWISSHNLTKEEADALWNATNSNWKKSYEDYSSKDTGNKSGNTGNTTNNSVPKNKTELAKLADSNGNGTLTQAEAWEWLSKQDIPEAQKASIWRNCGWKTSYYDYKEKHS